MCRALRTLLHELSAEFGPCICICAFLYFCICFFRFCISKCKSVWNVCRALRTPQHDSCAESSSGFIIHVSLPCGIQDNSTIQIMNHRDHKAIQITLCTVRQQVSVTCWTSLFMFLRDSAMAINKFGLFLQYFEI